VVLPIDVGWSDVGSWKSLWEVSDRDADDNDVRGDVIAVDTSGSLLISEGRLVATVGVRDLVVIETADAVLVAQQDRAQDVKRIVETLRSSKRAEHQTHQRVYRPWGSGNRAIGISQTTHRESWCDVVAADASSPV
jgi:hypothetical protein